MVHVKRRKIIPRPQSRRFFESDREILYVFRGPLGPVLTRMIIRFQFDFTFFTQFNLHLIRRKVNLPRLCSVGYVQNHTRGIYPGYHPTKNFCKFCRTFIPVPETSVSSVRLSNPYPELCELCTPLPQIPGVRVQHFVYLPGPSASSSRRCHKTRNFYDFRTRTRNFYKFCKTPLQLA